MAVGSASAAVLYHLQLQDQLSTPAKQAAGSVEDLREGARKALNGLGALAAGMLAAGAAAKGFLDDMTATVDEVNTLAAASGLANETVLGLSQAARASGKDLKDILPEDLPKRLADLQRGVGKAKPAFDALGIAATDVNGELRSSDDVLRELIDKLQAVEDPTTRAALATQALGRQGQQLLTAFGSSDALDRFVAQTSEFGLDVGPEAVAATGNWQAANAALSLSLDNVKQTVLDLLGGSGQLSEWMSGLSLGIVQVTEFVRELVDEIAEQFGRVGQLLRGDLGIVDFVRQSTAAGNALENAWEAATERAREFYELTIAAQQSTGDFVGPELPGPGGAANVTQAPGSSASSQGATVTVTSVEVTKLPEVEVTKLPTGARVVIDGEVSLGKTGTDIVDSLGREAAFAGTAASAALAALGPLGAIVAGVDRLPGLIIGITDTISSLPDTIGRLPDLIPELVEAIADLPAQLIERLPELLPELALAVAKGTTQLFLLPFTATADILAAAIGELPGAFAQAIAELLSKPIQGLGNLTGTDLTAERGQKTILGLDVPFFHDAEGNTVRRTGLAVLRAGQRVEDSRNPRAGGQGVRGGGLNIANVTIVANNPRELARELRQVQGSYGLGESLAALVAT